MPRIAISYRRNDSEVITGRIFDRLAAHYGRDAVFRDIDNIPPGVDFRSHISRVLDESDVLLAIVGPRWLGRRGRPSRLNDEADPVRVEVETSLHKQMPVIPVLVLRATMPEAAKLPDPMKDFAYRNAVQVAGGQDFDVHMARLIRALDHILEEKYGPAAEASSDAASPDAETQPVASAPMPATAQPRRVAAVPKPASPVATKEHRLAIALLAMAVVVVVAVAVAVAILARNPVGPAPQPSPGQQVSRYDGDYEGSLKLLDNIHGVLGNCSMAPAVKTLRINNGKAFATDWTATPVSGPVAADGSIDFTVPNVSGGTIRFIAKIRDRVITGEWESAACLISFELHKKN